MLYLLLQLGDGRYALEVSQVVDVLPLVSFHRLPNAPKGLAGFFNHHGAPVPLADLTEMIVGRPSQAKMSTRVILIEYRDTDGTKRLIGLLAERVTETLRRAEGDFRDAGVKLTDAPFLGPVTKDASGLIQRIEVRNLFSEALRRQLFQGALSLTNV